MVRPSLISEKAVQLNFSRIPRPLAVQTSTVPTAATPAVTTSTPVTSSLVTGPINTVNQQKSATAAPMPTSMNSNAITTPVTDASQRTVSSAFGSRLNSLAQPTAGLINERPSWVNEGIEHVRVQLQRNTRDIQTLQRDATNLAETSNQQRLNLRDVAEKVVVANHRLETMEPIVRQLGEDIHHKIHQKETLSFQITEKQTTRTVYNIRATPNNKAVVSVLASQPATACGPNAGLKPHTSASQPISEGTQYPPSTLLAYREARGELTQEQSNLFHATGAIRKNCTPSKPVIVTYAHSFPYFETIPAPEYNAPISPEAAHQQFLTDTDTATL